MCIGNTIEQVHAAPMMEVYPYVYREHIEGNTLLFGTNGLSLCV